jgi:hypothetical protein
MATGAADAAASLKSVVDAKSTAVANFIATQQQTTKMIEQHWRELCACCLWSLSLPVYFLMCGLEHFASNSTALASDH